MEMQLDTVNVLFFRSALGSSYLPQREAGLQCEQLQADSLFTSRGLYADDLPSSARPRPVGGTTGTAAGGQGLLYSTHQRALWIIEHTFKVYIRYSRYLHWIRRRIEQNKVNMFTASLSCNASKSKR